MYNSLASRVLQHDRACHIPVTPNVKSKSSVQQQKPETGLYNTALPPSPRDSSGLVIQHQRVFTCHHHFIFDLSRELGQKRLFKTETVLAGSSSNGGRTLGHPLYNAGLQQAPTKSKHELTEA